MICDLVAIDVNIFMHLLNREKNTCGHIKKLLDHLINQKTQLLIDQGNSIKKEYQKLQGLIGKKDDDFHSRILPYWFDPNNQESVKVQTNDGLMSAITDIIHEGKNADRIYVYVAFKKDRVLLTNDERDICNCRSRLLKKTKKHRPQNLHADILTSIDAYNRLQLNG